MWGLRRNTDALPASIQPVAGDLSDGATLRNLPGPFNVLFYTAGANEYSETAYREAYVDGLRNLLDAVEFCGGAGRFVFTSSTAVYAQDDGSVVDETSPAEPRSFSGIRVLEGENVLMSRYSNAVVVRLGGIYGPGRTGLIDRVRSGQARREIGQSHFLNVIHLDDICGTLEHLADSQQRAGVYIGVDDEPQGYNALLEWIAARLDVPLPPESASPQTRGRPIRNRRCSNAKLRASGYEIIYSNARAGYAALLTRTAHSPIEKPRR